MLFEGDEILFRIFCRTGNGGKINGFLCSSQLFRGSLSTACYDDHRYADRPNSQSMSDARFHNDVFRLLDDGFHTPIPMHRGYRAWKALPMASSPIEIEALRFL